MLKRYPHTATIIIKPKALAVADPDDGITGRDRANDVKLPIQGRFEDASGHGDGYSAKFYARLSPKYDHIGSDRGKLEIFGRSFEIVRLIPFQTHAEIWLK